MNTFARARLTPQLADELEPLLRLHHLEIAHYPDIPLDVNWAMYAQADATGRLALFTLRTDGELRGYAAFFVAPNPHYNTSLQAVQDVLWLHPALRGRFQGPKFLRWCDEQLLALGVQVVYHHVKAAHDFAPILMRLGYEHIDTIWGRRLDHGSRRSDRRSGDQHHGHPRGAESAEAGDEGSQATQGGCVDSAQAELALVTHSTVSQAGTEPNERGCRASIHTLDRTARDSGTAGVARTDHAQDAVGAMT